MQRLLDYALPLIKEAEVAPDKTAVLVAGDMNQIFADAKAFNHAKSHLEELATSNIYRSGEWSNLSADMLQVTSHTRNHYNSAVDKTDILTRAFVTCPSWFVEVCCI